MKRLQDYNGLSIKLFSKQTFPGNLMGGGGHNKCGNIYVFQIRSADKIQFH